MRKALPTPLLVVVLIVSLIASGLVRSQINSRRTGTAGSATLARLDSFALGLLLGGFRGPLVMMLWTSTENQKTTRDLADFDTKLELIRLLQPQFDSVHIYQVWNKASNQSAQVASLPTKYAIILDAIDYAQDVDAARRADVDIKELIGQTYFQKLGLDNNRPYYDQRLRNETRAPEPLVRISFPNERLEEFKKSARAVGVGTIRLNFHAVGDGRLSVALRASEAALLDEQFVGSDVQRETRRMRAADRHNMVLDADGNLLSADQLPGGEDLAYLRPFEPFPYGVPAHAFAFDYFSQALQLQLVQEQQHSQLSPRVISARPALSLREWAKNAFEQGRIAELEYIDAPSPESTNDRETLTAELPPTGMPRNPLYDEALWQYERIVQLIDASDQKFVEHLDRFPADQSVYLDDQVWLGALRAYALGDIAYLRMTQSSDSATRTEFGQAARANYLDAKLKLAQYLTRYHTEPFVIDQVGLVLNRFEATDVAPEAAFEAVRRNRLAAERDPFGFEYAAEAEEFGAYMDRIDRRLELLK